MPTLESTALPQSAVLWPFAGYDSYGQPAVESAVELSPDNQDGVRWVEGVTEQISPEGTLVAASDTVHVNRSRVITVGSIMWLGALADVPSPITNHREVIGVNATLDIKGRATKRNVTLQKIDEFPAVVGGATGIPSEIQRYSTTITGDGSTTNWDITHSFGLSDANDVIASFKDSNGLPVLPNWKPTNGNTINVDFGGALDDGYTVEVFLIA